MRIAVILMLLGLTGCSTQDIVAGRVGDLPPDAPPTYKTGYADGCYTVVTETCSASGRAPMRRDILLMKTDKDYALGWADGSRTCSCAGTAYTYFPLTRD